MSLYHDTYRYVRRAFSLAGPTVWNSLLKDMRDPECSVDLQSVAENISPREAYTA